MLNKKLLLAISQITSGIIILKFMAAFSFFPAHFLATQGDSVTKTNPMQAIIVFSFIGGTMAGIIVSGLQLILIWKYISNKILWIILNILTFILQIFLSSYTFLYLSNNLQVDQSYLITFFLLNFTFTILYLWLQLKFGIAK